MTPETQQGERWRIDSQHGLGWMIVGPLYGEEHAIGLVPRREVAEQIVADHNARLTSAVAAQGAGEWRVEWDKYEAEYVMVRGKDERMSKYEAVDHLNTLEARLRAAEQERDEQADLAVYLSGCADYNSHDALLARIAELEGALADAAISPEQPGESG